MIRFKFNYLTNTLAYQTEAGNIGYQPTEEQQFIRFNSSGFNLDSGGIAFRLQANKMVADFGEPQTITYYRKYLPKQEEVIFTFTEKDQIEKLSNSGARKLKKSNRSRKINQTSRQN